MFKIDAKILQFGLYVFLVIFIQIIIFTLLHNFTSLNIFDNPYSLPVIAAVNGILIARRGLSLKKK